MKICCISKWPSGTKRFLKDYIVISIFSLKWEAIVTIILKDFPSKLLFLKYVLYLPKKFTQIETCFHIWCKQHIIFPFTMITCNGFLMKGYCDSSIPFSTCGLCWGPWNLCNNLSAVCFILAMQFLYQDILYAITNLKLLFEVKDDYVAIYSDLGTQNNLSWFQSLAMSFANPQDPASRFPEEHNEHALLLETSRCHFQISCRITRMLDYHPCLWFGPSQFISGK